MLLNLYIKFFTAFPYSPLSLIKSIVVSSHLCPYIGHLCLLSFYLSELLEFNNFVDYLKEPVSGFKFSLKNYFF